MHSPIVHSSPSGHLGPGNLFGGTLSGVTLKKSSVTFEGARIETTNEGVHRDATNDAAVADRSANMSRFQTIQLVDPEAALLLEREMTRDLHALNLSAPESYMIHAVAEALAAPLPPSESYPGRRYHSGRSIINEIEKLCWQRALTTFQLSQDLWGVNVQAFSGSLANLYVYTALLAPGDTLLRMELSHGGHLSHGHRTAKSTVSEVASKFNSVPYYVHNETGIIDYDGLSALASIHKPRIITIGGSSYSRQIDYPRMRKIAHDANALLHCDMAHFCGLVAGKAMDSPFPYCDVVTTTTYKSFCGPKGAMIFFRNWMKEKINRTVFPRYQAARDYSVILAISIALLHAQTEEYRTQQQQVVQSSRILATHLQALGYSIVGGGSDSHMVLLNLKTCDVDAAEAEKALELVGIICNKNQIPGDNNGQCTGLRLGTPPMVIRGLRPAKFEIVATLVHETLKMTRIVHREIMQGKPLDSAAKSKHAMVTSFIEAIEKKDEFRRIKSRVDGLVLELPPPWQNFV